MTKDNTWNKPLGPMYDATGLERRGIDITELIGLTLRNGTVLYPHAQFDEGPDGSVEPRKKVLELWRNLIAPEIKLGLIDEWTASGLLLQKPTDGPSVAEQIADGLIDPDDVAGDISEFFGELRNGLKGGS